MTRVRVAVVFGGRSSEHGVSCVSAASVLGRLDPERFEIVPVGITRDGAWVLGTDDVRELAIDGRALPTVDGSRTALVLPGDPTRGGLVVLDPDRAGEVFSGVDVVFPVLHGPYGEDGTIQGLLEMAGVPYVGAGVLASAAGMDKDGRALKAWPGLGFGFVEVGTVTRHAQPGNPKPRLFRLTESEAIVNRMGFNNAGADALAARLQLLGPIGVPLGISLGKSKVTPVEDAVEDYLHSMRVLAPYADYVAINVSSPNTPGLRSLQDRDSLDALVGELRRVAGQTPLVV
ncbi:MAG: hypothetical protein L0I24_20200, partial [Pseudonocardia sp.]|nr:hypothetical protein [Pseudonocardia sp.]